MAAVFQPTARKTVRVLQYMTVTHQEYGHEPRLATYDFGMEAAPTAPLPELSRSRYARRAPVVVLQDGTVGTQRVPKQT